MALLASDASVDAVQGSAGVEDGDLAVEDTVAVGAIAADVRFPVEQRWTPWQPAAAGEATANAQEDLHRAFVAGDFVSAADSAALENCVADSVTVFVEGFVATAAPAVNSVAEVAVGYVAAEAFLAVGAYVNGVPAVVVIATGRADSVDEDAVHPHSELPLRVMDLIDPLRLQPMHSRLRF